MKIKIGVIGAGQVTRLHLDVIKDIDGLEAVGITSRTMEKAKQVSVDYDIPICSQDMAGLIKTAKPDALMVVVPADQMFSVVSAAILHGVPVFLEKPPGLAPDETKILAELAQKHSVRTMVGYNRRYYSIFHKGLKIIHEHGPLLGVVVEGHERMWKIADKIRSPVRSRWAFANSTHTIDLLRLFGGNPSGVRAISRRFVERNGDQFAAVMALEGGAIGQYSAHWYSPGGWRVVLYGDGATVEFRPLEEGRWTDRDFKTCIIEPDKVDKNYKPGFFRQMKAFEKMLLDNALEWPGQDLENAYDTMRLAQRIVSGAVDING